MFRSIFAVLDLANLLNLSTSEFCKKKKIIGSQAVMYMQWCMPRVFLKMALATCFPGKKRIFLYLMKVFGYFTLLEKQSKLPRYNMKCRGKSDTTWTIPRSITFSPLHFMLYRGKSIIFGTVYVYYTLYCTHCTPPYRSMLCTVDFFKRKNGPHPPPKKKKVISAYRTTNRETVERDIIVNLA